MQWKKLKILGSGSFGTVHLASPVESSFLLSPSVVAVKSADLDLSSTLQKERMFLGELRGEPNIIHCYGEDISIEGDQEVYNLLLEYAPGGTLDDLINKNKGTIPESHVACYTYMILKGIHAIHESETIHCDLKPENILIFPNGNNNGIHKIKIADFGLAKKQWESELLVWGKMGYNNGCTPMYASPESVTCSLRVTASDIWSLGCIVVKMITGEPIWSCSTRGELLSKIVCGKPKIPENLSEEGKDFLMRCFERTVHKRWTAEELLDHPFIIKNLKLLEDGTHPSSDCDSQRNPFGFGDWISTRDLFSTSSLGESDNLVKESSEESQHSYCTSESELIDMLYNLKA